MDKLQALGVECEEVGMPHVDYSLPCYYIIAPAECSSNLARYDGVRYGHRTAEPVSDIYDLFSKSRADSTAPPLPIWFTHSPRPRLRPGGVGSTRQGYADWGQLLFSRCRGL